MVDYTIKMMGAETATSDRIDYHIQKVFEMNGLHSNDTKLLPTNKGLKSKLKQEIEWQFDNNFLKYQFIVY